jgi:hypothetical protein
MIDAPRILDRRLGVIAGDPEPLRALEDRLEAFAAAFTDAPVDAQGKFQVNMGKIDVPPEANGISGRPITLDPIVLTGRFASEKFCAELSGKVTQPISIELAPGDGKNICLFTPAKEGDTAPAFKEAEFVCK